MWRVARGFRAGWFWVAIAFVVGASPCASVQRPAAQGAKRPTGQRDFTAKEVYALVKDSVVRIETDKATGTGFFVRDGRTVVTCFHVVEGASKVCIRASDGVTLFRVDAVALDPDADVAVLHLDAESCRKPIKCGPIGEAGTGDPVYVVGNPLGFLTDSLSSGLVSGDRIEGRVHFIQVSAAISHGSSGSPLLNARAEVIGVVEGSFEKGQALNMAVAIQHAKLLLDKEFQPLSALKVVEEPKKSEPTEEEKGKAEEAEKRRGSELFAEFWSGIEAAYCEWVAEYSRDGEEWGKAGTLGSADPVEVARKAGANALRLARSTWHREALNDFLRTRIRAATGVDDLDRGAEALVKIGDDVVAACSNSWMKVKYGSSEQLNAAFDAEMEAWKRLEAAISGLEDWGKRQEWFSWDVFDARLSAPVMWVNSVPKLEGFCRTWNWA